MRKRVLSLFLSLALCVTITPGTVYAKEYDSAVVSGSEEGREEITEAASVSGNAGNTEAASVSGNAGNIEAASVSGSAGNIEAASVSGNAGNIEAASESGNAGNAEEATVSGNGTGTQESAQEQVEAVQKLINALPAPESLKTADKAAREAAYWAAQEAYDAYEALTGEQQALLTGTACFEALFSWFNAQIQETGECEHIQGNPNITQEEDGTVTCAICGALEASVTVNGSQIFYRTLSEAVAAAEANATITLHKDVVLQSDLTIDKKEVSLDLRQRTLSLDNCNLRIAAEGVSILSGYPGVSEMGKIQQNTSGGTVDSTKGYVIVGGGTESASLYLQSGTVEKVSVEDNGYFSMDQKDVPRDDDDPDSEPWYTKVGTLCQSGSGQVYLDGGSITKGISGSMTIQEMLGDLHGLQYEDGTWLKAEVLDGKTLTLTDGSSVKAVESPLNMLEMDSYSTETEYGANFTPDIRVSVNRAEGYEDKTVTYTWYLDDEKDEDCTGATYTFPEGKPVKTKQGATEAEDTVEPYVVKCVAACEGYERSVSTEITVEKANLLGAIIVIRGTANTYSCTYNAKSQDIQEQTIVVMLRYAELTKDTDYVIDTEASDLTATEVGSYVFKIKAARGGNYTGEKVIEWNINPCVLTESDCTVEFEQDSFPYTGSEIEPKVKVTYTYGGETITVPAEEYTVDYLDNVELGTATACIYNAEGGNYEVNGKGYFEIAKAEISPKPEVTIENWTYGENAKLPGITANPGYGDVEYYYNTTDSNQNGRTWDFSEVDALSPGDYYAYAVIGESTYYKACTTETKKFTVEKTAVPVDTWPSLKDIYVGDTLTADYLIGGTCDAAAGSFSIQGTYCWDTIGTKEVTVAYTLAAPNEAYRQTTTKTITINVIKRAVTKVEEQTAVTDKAFLTPLAGLGLPATVNITAAGGKEFANVPVTWSGYNASTLEPQTLTGTLDLSGISGEVQQSAQAVKAEITVTLQPAAVQQPTYADKSVTYNAAGQGNPIEKPAGVASVTYEYEGKNGTVYEKSGTAPAAVGSYTVTASFTMAYGYQQLAPVSATLTIGVLDLDAAVVVLGAEVVANGTEQAQTVAAVRVGDVTLRAGDYTISGNTGTEVGPYELTITGTGNCSGEVKKTWYIVTQRASEASGTGTGSGAVTAAAPSYDWKDVNHTLLDTLGKENTGDSTYPTDGNVNVRIPGENMVPVYVLETLRESNLTLALHQGNGVALSISSYHLKEDSLSGLAALDLTTDTSSDRIPAELIKEKQAASYRQLAIKDTGSFPMTVDLHVNVGAENAGRYANFYRYNEELGKLEYLGSFRVTEQGQAMTALSQGGSYLVTVTDEIPEESGYLAGDVYTVKKGDTLGRIARRYRTTVQKLLARNPQIVNPNRIRVGQKIVIY